MCEPNQCRPLIRFCPKGKIISSAEIYTRRPPGSRRPLPANRVIRTLKKYSLSFPHHEEEEEELQVSESVTSLLKVLEIRVSVVTVAF